MFYVYSLWLVFRVFKEESVARQLGSVERPRGPIALSSAEFELLQDIDICGLSTILLGSG